MKELLDFTFSMSPCYKIIVNLWCKNMASKESTTPSKTSTSVYSNNKKEIVCSLHHLYIKDKVHEAP